jgi:predicted O-methyltransferase YrrM
MSSDEGQLREVVFSSKHATTIRDRPLAVVDEDPLFARLFATCRAFTMTSKEAMFALYSAVRYVAARRIQGDFVECGVWRGGSSLLAALALRAVGERERRCVLYDTFTGMTEGSDVDVDVGGGLANDYIARYGDDGRWCYAGEDEVLRTFARHGVPNRMLRVVAGDVERTLREHEVPQRIAILRLDTDWYASTSVELEVLYPRLAVGGVLIVDDYGHWAGARRAVDEYFAAEPILLHRIDHTVRVGIKI